MRRRAAARLLVLDAAGRVLLFRFVHDDGALAGQSHWATPGGGVEPGESFEKAARRELAEETGLRHVPLGPTVGRRETVLRLPDGETVLADERYFLVEAGDAPIDRVAWTAHERRVMREHRWWSEDEIAATSETVWPETLLAMLHGQRGS